MTRVCAIGLQKAKKKAAIKNDSLCFSFIVSLMRLKPIVAHAYVNSQRHR